MTRESGASTLPEPDKAEAEAEAETIARAIRAHRAQRRLSLAEAARASGVSAAHLSRIEHGERSPSITVLMQLARAYRVSLGVLVGEEAASTDDTHLAVRRARTATATAVGPVSGVAFEALGSNTPGALLQASRLTFAPGAASRRTSHEGEEWVYVESGTLLLAVGTENVDLHAGDSAQFDAELGHRLSNPIQATVSVLLVSSIPHQERHRP